MMNYVYIGFLASKRQNTQKDTRSTYRDVKGPAAHPKISKKINFFYLHPFFAVVACVSAPFFELASRKKTRQGFYPCLALLNNVLLNPFQKTQVMLF